MTGKIGVEGKLRRTEDGEWYFVPLEKLAAFEKAEEATHEYCDDDEDDDEDTAWEKFSDEFGHYWVGDVFECIFIIKE